MTRRPTALLVVAALGGLLWACTRADLFGSRDEPSLPDKITLSGTVCSDNPLQRRFPVKVIFLIDGSTHGATATGGVINQFRTQALSDVFNLYGGAGEISWSIIKYDGETEGLTNDEYTKDVLTLQQGATRAGLPCSGGNAARCQQRRYELALERANNLVTGDLLTTEPGIRSRTRYVIVLYAEGPRIGPDAVAAPDGGFGMTIPDAGMNADAGFDPGVYYCDALCLPPPGGFMNACGFNPPCEDGCHFERQVRAMREFAVDKGAADLVVHSAHFLTTPVAAPPAGQAACCPTGATDDQCRAQQVLARIAAAGGGTYLQFASPGEVSFRALEYAATKNVFIMKTLVAANLNARPSTNGFIVDSDADGLTDEQEDPNGNNRYDADRGETNLYNRDTDGDGLGDYLETLLANLDVDPLVPDAPATCANIPSIRQDRDGDGLTDCEEILLGTDPTLFDSDSDGYPDLLEMMYGTNYLLNDVNTDTDQDGARNGDEIKAHTDPRSNDARTRGDLSYLYRVIVRDDGTGRGLSRVMDIQQPRALTGVTVRAVTPRVYPGVSTLRFNRANTTLEWRDNYGGTDYGPAVRVDRRGEYTLHSRDSISGDELQERSIRVDVIPELLPVRDLAETLQVRETERQCVDWRIRNITLVHTNPRSQQERTEGITTGAQTQEGMNRILVYYGQTPLATPISPGLFRVADVPMVFVPPDYKYPDVAELNVPDEDFVLLGENLGTGTP